MAKDQKSISPAPTPAPQRVVSASGGIDRGGPALMYYVGLIESAPFDVIDVPTVAVALPDGKGAVRGKCVSVPKYTGRLQDDGKGNLDHIANATRGRFEKLYPVEHKAFLEYVNTHVFREVGRYSVDVPPKQAGHPVTEQREHWRAEIEPLDSAYATTRGLHDEESIRREILAKYVWIVPANVGADGKPLEMGPQPTVAEMEAKAAEAVA